MANKGDIKTANFAGGENIAVLFGGYNVKDAEVRAWAEGLMFWSTPKLTDFAVISLFAVPGPADSLFRKNEFKLDVLADAVAKAASRFNSKLIIFAGHSSGAAVAEAALAVFAKQSPSLLSRVVYYRLDGAGGLPPTLLAKLAGGYCVSAKCGAVPSMNSGGCGGKFKPVTLKLPPYPAQCAAANAPAKAKGMCCHVALVNTSPNTSTAAEYARYTATSLPNGGWLRETSAKLKSVAGLP